MNTHVAAGAQSQCTAVHNLVQTRSAQLQLTSNPLINRTFF
jgi:hypothetical protein